MSESQVNLFLRIQEFWFGLPHSERAAFLSALKLYVGTLPEPVL